MENEHDAKLIQQATAVAIEAALSIIENADVRFTGSDTDHPHEICLEETEWDKVIASIRKLAAPSGTVNAPCDCGANRDGANFHKPNCAAWGKPVVKGNLWIEPKFKVGQLVITGPEVNGVVPRERIASIEHDNQWRGGLRYVMQGDPEGGVCEAMLTLVDEGTANVDELREALHKLVAELSERIWMESYKCGMGVTVLIDLQEIINKVQALLDRDGLPPPGVTQIEREAVDKFIVYLLGNFEKCEPKPGAYLWIARMIALAQREYNRAAAPKSEDAD